MSSLANQQQNLSFPGLLQVPGGITSTLQQVQDGNGNVTGLSLSSAGASVTTSSTFQASENGTTITGALPRLISDGFGDFISVKDFGAIGDGVTDDTVAIQAALTALTASGGGVLNFPKGTYIVSSALVINAPIRLQGDGAGYISWGAYPTATIGTTIKYTGSASTSLKVITFLDINGGSSGIRDIAIDCNNLAGYGCSLEGIAGGEFSNLTVLKFTYVGVVLQAGTSGLTTCSWNSFTNLRINPGSVSTGKAALWLRGTPTLANACHNTFVNTQINFIGSQSGIILGCCDNNYFAMTFIYCPSSGVTGYGVELDILESTGFPIANVFTHLQSSVRGWYQPAATVNNNYVYAYMQDNAQPLPELSANASLITYFDNMIFNFTATIGTGWSGGTPTFVGTYTVSGRTVNIKLIISGTAVVAGANATVTGLPSFNTTAINGVNLTSSSQNIVGYASNGTLVIVSGITSFSSAIVQISGFR
jgi:hypothetical protein